MSADPSPSGTRCGPQPGTSHDPRRLFLREPGWRIGQKTDNAREFCFMVAPGQNFYHRLLDGEVFVYHGDERLCLACAERRGLLCHEPKGLRESVAAQELALQADTDDEFGLAEPPWPED